MDFASNNSNPIIIMKDVISSARKQKVNEAKHLNHTHVRYVTVTNLINKIWQRQM